MNDAPAKTRIIFVMGVSGSGKTTFGSALAARLEAGFVEADDFHPASNKKMMAAGHPLGDAERWPWLKAVAEEVLRRVAAGAPAVVVACSALKRRYRDFLRAEIGAIFFIHLDGTPELLHRRMAARKGHFMPVSLLQSQIDALEPLGPDEEGMVVDISPPVDEMVRRALAVLDPTGATGEPA